jgi:hypothetical protein
METSGLPLKFLFVFFYKILGLIGFRLILGNKILKWGGRKNVALELTKEKFCTMNEPKVILNCTQNYSGNIRIFPYHAAILPVFGCNFDTPPIFSRPDTRISELPDTCLGCSVAAMSANHILNAPFPALKLVVLALVKVHVMEIFGSHYTRLEMFIIDAT